MKKRILFLLLIICESYIGIAQKSQREQKPIIQFQPNGHFLQQMDSLQISSAKLPSKLNELLGLNDNYTFTVFNSQKDDIGMVHQSYQQYYKGIKVQDNMVLAHSKDGKVMALNGDIVLEQDISISPKISTAIAMQKAKTYLNYEGELKDSNAKLLIATKLVERNEKRQALCYEIKLPTVKVYIHAENGEVFNELSLVAHGNIIGSGQTKYSGMQSFNCSQTGNDPYLLLDEVRKIHTLDATHSHFDANDFLIPDKSNSFLFKSNNILWDSKSISSFSVYGVEQTNWYSIIDQEPDIFFEVVNGNGDIVYTSEVTNNTTFPLNFSNLHIPLFFPPYQINIMEYDYLSPDDLITTINLTGGLGLNTFSDGLNTGQYTFVSQGNPALDAHWGLSKAYDYFLYKFNRNSFDANGGTIKQYLFPQYTGVNNAVAVTETSSNYLAYFKGDGFNYRPWVSLDIVAHEYTHLITKHNGQGGLNYQNESGALNESFSDIFGTCVEFATNISPDYYFGEDIVTNQQFIRSIENPSLSNQPNLYGSIAPQWHDYTTNSSDNGGVHVNSGVQNRWFYLLCNGGSQNGYTVPANVVGMDKASKICYNTLMHFLTPNATYADARNTSLLNTIYLYGFNSAEYLAVENAWNAVNVLAPTNYIPPQTCVGNVTLTSNFGFFNDGSGSNNYSDYNNCSWLIQPSNGASSLQLWFDSFDLITGDTLWIYEGPNSNGNLLGAYTNTFTPPSFTTTGGSFYLIFKSNWAFTAQGFSAHYLATMNTALGDYEYWFDQNYGNKVVGNSAFTSLTEFNFNAPVSSISPNQIHSFNFRCKDNIGKWSSVLTHDFYYAGASKITRYEYWFDNDLANKVYLDLSIPTSYLDINSINTIISNAGISNGIHAFHFRAKNESGVWSSVITHDFYKAGEGLLSEYEYWFDNDYNTKIVTTFVTPQAIFDINTLSANFPTNNLPGGLHTFHFRAKTLNGIWSSAISHTFYKLSGNGLVSYQYWFDDDYVNATTWNAAGPQPSLIINPMNSIFSTSNLSHGLHKLHFRTQSESGYWSSVLTHDFNIVGSNLVAYEYWFNNDFSNRVNNSISQSNSLEWQANLNVSSLPYGSHKITFRFKDDLGKWSSAMTEGFCKGLGDSAVTLKFFMQGYYNSNQQMLAVMLNQGVSNDNTITDSVEIQLRSEAPPYTIIASKYISQKTNGIVETDFPNTPNGNYYLVLKHRNSLETWSSSTVYKGDCSLSYDFTTAATQAYGNNQVEVEPGIFAIYTGDMNQDGFIDSFDFPTLDTDIFNGVSGMYVNTDLNGDGFVDSFDFPVFDANSYNGVSVMTP